MNKKNTTKKAGVRPGKVTHMDRIKSRLGAIKPNITTGDRRAAQQEFGYSRSTISKYLAGHIMSVETALDLLTFFNNRVTEREDKLKTLSI